MTGIVERLRKASVYEEYKAVLSNLGDEAADAIERLREQMESGNYLTEHDKLSLAIERQALEIKERDDEIERLRAQVTALRAALEWIAEDDGGRAGDEARAALGEPKT